LRKFSDRYSSNDAALAEGHSHHEDPSAAKPQPNDRVDSLV
jgi:hypothetical protein